jgi:hypothetical protein
MPRARRLGFDGLGGSDILEGLMSFRQEGVRRATRHPRLARRVSVRSFDTARQVSPVFESLENRQLMAVITEGLFEAARKSGIPVSATDLINGLVPAPADTNYIRTHEGGPLENLTNGRTNVPTATDPNPVDQGSSQGNSVFSLDNIIPPEQQHGPSWWAIYRLDLAASPAGYDITQVDSVTGHQDTRTNQTIDVEVQYLGDPNFYSLSGNNNFSFRPNPGGNGGSRLRIRDDTGAPLATGIRAIRMEMEADAVFRELDIFGTPAPAPTAAPAAPTNLQTQLQGTNVRLSWTDQANNEAGFRVERVNLVGGVEQGNYVQVGSVRPSPNTGAAVVFTDSATSVGQNYRYRVSSFNAFNGFTASAPLTADVVTPTGGQGAYARFFSQGRWVGSPVVTQVDTNLSDNNFGTGSPHPLVPEDQFSAIYTGTLTIPADPAGTTFYFETDIGTDPTDVGILFLRTPQGQVRVRDNSQAFDLAPGQKVEFVYLASEDAGNAQFNLKWWKPSSLEAETIPASALETTMTPVTVAPTGVAEEAKTTNTATVRFVNGAPNAAKLQLERADVVGGVPGAYVVVAEDAPDVTTLTDNTANPATTYSYRVRAFNFEGSAVSAPVQIRTADRVARAGASGAWYNSGFWGRTRRPGTTNVSVNMAPTYREEVDSVNFPNGTLDRPGDGLPANNDNYSTAFTGKINIPAGEGGQYTFIANTDDQGFLWVNGQLVSVTPGPDTPITLAPGSYNFVFLQAEQAGGSAAIMQWQPPGVTTPVPVPGDYLTNISDLPARPGDGAADTATARSVTLNFVDNSTSELRYKIEQSTSPTFATIDRTFSAPINATTFTVPNLAQGTTYYFRIRGTNLEGEGEALTSTVTTATSSTPPAAPSLATGRATSTRNVTVRWQDNSNNESSFVIQRRVGATGTFSEVGTVEDDVTVFQDQVFPAPAAGTPVTYRIIARNEEGDSAFAETTVAAGAPGGTGLSAIAYANLTWTDDPVDPADTVSYIDPEIGESWSLGPPVDGIPGDNFSVKWNGTIRAEKTETYTFYVSGDNETGLKITDSTGAVLGEIPVGPNNEDGSARSFTVPLVAGQHYTVEMRQFEVGDGASAFLEWSTPTTPREVIPQVFLFPEGVQASVSEVYVSGSAWPTTFRDFVQSSGFGTSAYGYKLAATPSNADTVSWTNVNQVVLRYSGPIGAAGVPSAGSIVVDGVRTDYTVTGVETLDDRTVRLTLDRPLGNVSGGGIVGDRVTLTVPGAGAGGGNFVQQVNVLQGDANRDTAGRVNANDQGYVKSRLNRSTTSPTSPTQSSYTIFADVDASGRVNSNDQGAVKSRLNDNMPAPAAAGDMFSTTRIAEEVLA